MTAHRVIKVGTGGEGDLKPGFPAKFTYIAIPVAGIPTAVRWSFLLFICTLPFDAIELPLMIGSVTKLSGLLFFAFYFLYYGPLSTKRSFPYPSRAMWWFLGYLVVFVLNGLFVGEEFVDDFYTRFFQQVQLAVFFWLAWDLLKNEKFARSVLLAYSITSGLVAVANILQLPGFYNMSSEGRESSAVTTSMGFAAVITIGLCLYTSYKHLLSKIFLLVLTFLLLVVMVATGTRGQFFGFMIGSSAYVFPYWRSKRTWIAIILVILSFVAVLYTTANNPAVLERWRRAYYEVDSSGRDKLYPIVGDMILEKPVLGWSVAGPYEVGRREGERFFSIARDTHNTFLAVLLEVGIVGAIPFLVGLWLCGLSAWRARLGNLGLLPLALFFGIVAVSMFGNLVWQKVLWLFLALTLAAAPTMPRKLGKQFPALLRISPSRVAEKRLGTS
jgi:O-antigen ligase